MCRTGIPEKNLAGIRSSDDEIRMVRAEGDGGDDRLRQRISRASRWGGED